MTNSIEDIRLADVIFIVGSNTTEQHPLVAERVIDAKKRRGAKLIVVDPRRTALAGMADLHLPIVPGTDLALIKSLCHVILAEGLENKEFIAARSEGLDPLKKSTATATPEWAAQITGVPAEKIAEAARIYARGPNSTLLYCMGITQHSNGTANCMALADMVMLCGMIGRPHTGLNPLRGQNNVQGACDMGALPNVLTAYVPAGSADAKNRFAPLWGDFANAAGLTLTDMLKAAAHGDMRGLFIMGENPVLSDPDSAHVREALSKLDLLVVQDIFMTETARLAHVVLPAASWLGKEGTFTNTERRVQKVNQVLSPRGQALPDWKILTMLLKALGQKADYAGPEDIFNEMRSVTPSYAGMTYKRIEEAQGLCWPCPSEDHPGTPYLHRETFARGKGKFSPIEELGPMEAPDAEFPFRLTTGRVGFLYHTSTMTGRAWALDREFPDNFVELHPDDAKRIGVKDNWNVKVSSRRGHVLARVKVTSNIVPGVAFMPFHFSENPANALTGPYLDAIVKTPAFKVCAVKIEEA